MEYFISFEFFKISLSIFILILSLLYIVVLIFSVVSNKHKIDFLSTIKRDGRISKAGIFFFIVMLIIIYQALFLPAISPELTQLMLYIIGGDVGASFVSKYGKIEATRIRKTTEKLSSDEFKDL